MGQGSKSFAPRLPMPMILSMRKETAMATPLYR